MKRTERLEAFTVCVGYADFLNETAKWNMPHFDEWVIGTTPDDQETRELCRKYNLKCIVSEDASKHGDGFNKGRLIDRILQHSSAGSWRLHLDADIALPMGARDCVQSGELHKDFIYGVDRVDVHSYEKWQELIQVGFMHAHLDYGCRVKLGRQGLTMGDRWAHPVFGYVPIGFFQLWHSDEDEWRGIRVKDYAHAHNTACRTDVQFGLQWDRTKRAVIPELVVAHLMSERVPLGTNWKGRKTKPFGPGQHHKKHHHHKHHCGCYHDHDKHCHKHGHHK